MNRENFTQVEGFYFLKSRNEAPLLVHGYRCSDLGGVFVFGFNTHDGAGLVLLSDLTEETEIIPVTVTPCEESPTSNFLECALKKSCGHIRVVGVCKGPSCSIYTPKKEESPMGTRKYYTCDICSCENLVEEGRVPCTSYINIYNEDRGTTENISLCKQCTVDLIHFLIERYMALGLRMKAEKIQELYPRGYSEKSATNYDKCVRIPECIQKNFETISSEITNVKNDIIQLQESHKFSKDKIELHRERIQKLESRSDMLSNRQTELALRIREVEKL